MKNGLNRWAVSCGLGLSLCAAPAMATDLGTWIQGETPIATSKLLANISPQGATPGVVLASPSKESPNYYFHWIRDAGLTMEVIATLYERTADKSQRAHYEQMLRDYADFSRVNQLTSNPSGTPADHGLGEPKFNVDGSAFTGDWGRPQNDGPAIRASTLIRFANRLLDQGQNSYVRSRLYDGKIPAESVIKADLEYVSHHWREASFDLWEETKGQHFYTRMVQRRALIQGADLADRLGDAGAAAWYRDQANQISGEIEKHWDEGNQIIRATRDGGDWKWTGLDTAVMLGVLHGSIADGFMGPTDDRVLSTIERLESSFRAQFPINNLSKDGSGLALGVAMGRYPEDKYTGYDSNGPANPWFLITNGLAEFHYRAAHQLASQGSFTITQRSERFFRSLPVQGPNAQAWTSALQKHVAGSAGFNAIISALEEAGDAVLRRTQYHTPSDGSFSEQINRDNGFIWGARDLTWSYASYLTAVSQR